MIPISVLDLCPVLEGSDTTQTFRNTLDLAQHAETWGYQRYWLAEHHNMIGIASAATSVVMGHVASGTKTIRVGAGGVMLPNHSPLLIAEQFGTLAALYPGRIDLGVGRAPGTDQVTSQALRRDLMSSSERFPQDVQELMHYFAPERPGQKVRAVPGAGLEVPVWILGSSLFGAQLAAALGLPYAFASHFAPDQLDRALQIYRAQFQPSEKWKRPHTMVAFNAVVAATDDEAKKLFTSAQRQFVNLRRGMPGKLQAPSEVPWSYDEEALLDQVLACRAVGSPSTVKKGLAAFLARTQPDELIVTGQIYDHAARLESFRLFSELHQ
ncbi:MAG: LLM class flavin-dependent oxidoreductase [Archangium sp.]|nr:LLM class flavin-dependent oxidoreductase [Archangium sp.]